MAGLSPYRKNRARGEKRELGERMIAIDGAEQICRILAASGHDAQNWK
jgi:hypothetical protein